MTECVTNVSDYDIPMLICHHIFPSPLLPIPLSNYYTWI